MLSPAHSSPRTLAARAFTLIELLVVIAIIGILAALLLPNLLGAGDEAKEVDTRTQIRNIQPAMQEYQKGHPQGHYPDDDPSTWNTVKLVEALSLKGLFDFKDDELDDLGAGIEWLDGWKQPWEYKAWLGKPKSQKLDAHNVRTYDLQSAGGDGDMTTEDDNITNWSKQLAAKP